MQSLGRLSDIEISAPHPNERIQVASLLEAAGLPLAGLDEVKLLVARARDVKRRRKVSALPEIAGVVGLETYDAAGLIRSLVVDPSWQHRGIGRLLVAFVLKMARSMGINKVWLLTTTAGPFFRHLGFINTRRDKAPPKVKSSPEFRYACPASAQCLYISLYRGSYL